MNDGPQNVPPDMLRPLDEADRAVLAQKMSDAATRSGTPTNPRPIWERGRVLAFEPTPDPAVRYLLARGLSPATIKAVGESGLLRYLPAIAQHPPGCAFKLIDRAGEMVGIHIVGVAEDTPNGRVWKVGERPKKTVGRSGLLRIPGSDKVVVVEGPEDALSVYEATGFTVVATLSKGMLRHALEMLSGAPDITLFADPDAVVEWEQVAQGFAHGVTSLRICSLARYKDPNTVLMAAVVPAAPEVAGLPALHSREEAYDVITATIANARQVQSVPGRSAVGSGPDRAIRVRVSDVKAEPVRWFWPGRIALGKYALIAGDPGLGKSQLTAYLAAKATTGGRWPNDDGHAPQGSCLMLSCEDEVADTIRPRLDAAGADVARVHVIETMKTPDGGRRGLNLARDLNEIEETLQELGDVNLLIIDPITAYLGGTDTHRTADVRAVLAPLQDLASRFKIAVVAVSHLNKAGGDRAMSRVTGSLGFVAAARSAFLVTPDPSDDSRRLFVTAKNNLANVPGLAFRIEERVVGDGITAPFVQFDPGTVAFSADDALAANAADEDHYRKLDEAIQFLMDELVKPISAKEVYRRAEDAGISKRTIERAKQQAGVVAKKIGMAEGWVWLIPGHTKIANEDEERQA